MDTVSVCTNSYQLFDFSDFINSLDTLHPCYGNQDQQDANEFLVRVMEQMHSALPTGPTNPVEIHFQCEVVEIRHCPKYIKITS